MDEENIPSPAAAADDPHLQRRLSWALLALAVLTLGGTLAAFLWLVA
jgi:hypothetical protein